MKFKQLLEDDDAVSPVIGVILMVAITVILAAVIGTFVLGLGDQVQTTAPNAQFQFDYDSSHDGNLTIIHQGGDGITGEEVFLSGDVAPTQSGDMSWADQAGKTGTIKAGSDVIVGNYTADSSVDYNWSSSVDETASGAEVRVVWQDADSDQSSTMRTWTED